METCIGPDCNRPVKIKKWRLCSYHYQQHHAGKELTPASTDWAPPPECPVHWCNNLVASRGLCNAHASVAWRMSVNPVDYAELVNKGCDICGRDDAPMHFDHDHECCPGNYSCGRCLRGVLCNRCNHAVERRHDPTGQYTAYLGSPPGVATTYRPARDVDNHPGRSKVPSKS
jgi:hypothetical protein